MYKNPLKCKNYEEKESIKLSKTTIVDIFIPNCSKYRRYYHSNLP